MAKAAKDSMMQANEDKKQIKELQAKLDLALKTDAEFKKLSENETRLKKQIEESERVVADLQDEYKILEG
jgi:predicted  nucleic acid-binding Zn-ribbon protein